MKQNISGDNFSTTNLNPTGKRTGSLQSSITGLLVAGLSGLLKNCAYDTNVKLTITETKYKFPLHQTIFFTVAGSEQDLHKFQQALNTGLQRRA